jgi:predicted nucleic acid-binding protein
MVMFDTDICIYLLNRKPCHESILKRLTRLRLRPTRCIILHRHSKRVTRCSDTPPKTIYITAPRVDRIAGSLSGPRPFKATIVAVS